EAPLFQRAGHEILDEDVGVADQALQQILTAGMREVQRHRSLAARVDLPPQLPAVAQPRAERIAAARVLDLDDIGAVIGEDGGQHAAGNEPRAVDDSQALEGAAHFTAFLMWAASASMTRASASFSVRPVALTWYSMAVASHWPASSWETSTSNFMLVSVALRKCRVAGRCVGDRVVVLGGGGPPPAPA